MNRRPRGDFRMCSWDCTRRASNTRSGTTVPRVHWQPIKAGASIIWWRRPRSRKSVSRRMWTSSRGERKNLRTILFCGQSFRS